ncbi:PIR protein [Plasmodium ovale]|uniref:PIR protein n=1 Tax=Plasmodium ovale TaxID=36330 RepID=A0A1C3KTH5_PLAOA|nr:PIR protein [Plasmodium ovale]
MSETKLDDDLNKMHDFLKSLPLYKFFHLMENKEGLVVSNSKCSNNLGMSHKGYFDVVILCRKSENILHSLESTFNSEFKLEDKDRYCNYFKFWLNAKTKMFEHYSYNVNMLYQSLMHYHFVLKDDYSCSNIIDLKIREGNLEIYKYLFFHTENLYWINKKFKESLGSDTTSLSNYLEKCSDYYDKIICTDTCEKNVLYKEQLEDFKNEFNSTILHLLSIKPDIELKQLESPTRHRCKERDNIIKCPMENREEKWNTIILDPDGEAPSDDTASLLSTIVILFIFSGITILFSLFILYKFTPLGSWLQHFIQKKRKICGNFNEENEQFLSTLSNDEIYSTESTYNIAYNSAYNSAYN